MQKYPQALHGHYHNEKHFVNRVGWLRAAVLGANDGLLSTSSLMVGVAAAGTGSGQLVMTGMAGIVAGAMSMAAGEFVSVSSQADSEKADVERERAELERDPDFERRELAGIYIQRGLSRELAEDVAAALTIRNALEAHTRDELGITDVSNAKPFQAAAASAASFTIGGLPALGITLMSPETMVLWTIYGGAVALLAILGVAGSKAGGAPISRAVVRMVFWGTLAMSVSAAIGHIFRTSMP